VLLPVATHSPWYDDTPPVLLLLLLCRQPSVLLLAAPSAPGQPGITLCAELAAVGASLAHLELSSPTASWLAGLGPGLGHLSCLSLSSCPNLSTGAIQQVLQQLPQVCGRSCCCQREHKHVCPRRVQSSAANSTLCVLAMSTQLTSLDLHGISAVTDALAPTLASLANLAVLQLNHTSCSDATVEWLTYGSRLHQWNNAVTAGQQHTAGAHSPTGPVSSAPNQPQQWPRCGAWSARRQLLCGPACSLLVVC
jgi:hypothetical protein